MDDYDKGDSGVTIEEIFKKANDEYWEPGEDRYMKNRLEVPVKLYEQIFGPNGPQTLEELEDIPDAETRYKAWTAQHGSTPYDVIDSGKEYDIFNVIVDPEWKEKMRTKKPPIPYWFETRKGRKAWLKKYVPGIAHGSKYRVYFNTPNGPLERVPAWATYVQPGKCYMDSWKCFILPKIWSFMGSFVYVVVVLFWREGAPFGFHEKKTKLALDPIKNKK